MSKSSKLKSMNRREFVRSSGLAAGVAMLTPAFLNAKAHIDGTDVIKVGVIGCGGRGRGAAVQALSTKQNVRLVAMADAFRDNIDKSYKVIIDSLKENEIDTSKVQVPEEHKFDGFDGYLKVISLCDVVILATPPGFRPMHFEAAINAGKHVFMEKPVAVDAVGVRKVLEVAELAKSKKLNVVVGLQRHYQQQYTDWVDMLHGGAIGEIVTSHVYWNSGGVWVRPREAGQTEMEYQMRNWYYFNWLCGDHINEQHIHNLDVGNWVKQAYPIKAHGMGGRQVRTGKEYGEIYDHHFVEYEYADGSRMFSQCRHIANCEQKVSESFQGTNGTAPSPGVVMTKNGYKLMNENGKNHPDPYQVEHDMLFATIAKGEYKFADAENGAKSTLTAIMGRMATYSGQVINWNDAMDSKVDLMPKKYAFDAVPPVLPDKDGFYPVAVPGQSIVI